LQQYQASRAQFAQSVADLASRPESVESLLQEDILSLLKNLLSDSSPGIQRNAAVAIGKLAGQSPLVAEMIIQQNVLSELLCRNANQPNVCTYLSRLTVNYIKFSFPSNRSKIIFLSALSEACSTHYLTRHREAHARTFQKCDRNGRAKFGRSFT